MVPEDIKSNVHTSDYFMQQTEFRQFPRGHLRMNKAIQMIAVSFICQGRTSCWQAGDRQGGNRDLGPKVCGNNNEALKYNMQVDSFT
jgi:hypothetical protein